MIPSPNRPNNPKTDKTNKTIRIKTDRTNKTIRKFVRNHLNRPKVLIVLIVLSCLFHLSLFTSHLYCLRL